MDPRWKYTTDLEDWYTYSIMLQPSLKSLYETVKHCKHITDHSKNIRASWVFAKALKDRGGGTLVCREKDGIHILAETCEKNGISFSRNGNTESTDIIFLEKEEDLDS
jgi:hypothetical protein